MSQPELQQAQPCLPAGTSLEFEAEDKSKVGGCNKNVAKLHKVYEEYGQRSEEFYQQVKQFIVFLQDRYLGYYDPDCQNDCYVRILDSLEYYDSTRGTNIGTWVFTVVRNRISSFLYAGKKKARESGRLYESMECPSDRISQIVEEDARQDALIQFARLRMFGTSALHQMLETGIDHPLQLKVRWESMRELRRRKENQLRKPVMGTLWS